MHGALLLRARSHVAVVYKSSSSVDPAINCYVCPHRGLLHPAKRTGFNNTMKQTSALRCTCHHQATLCYRPVQNCHPLLAGRGT
jgi:hypothetical protein